MAELPAREAMEFDVVIVGAGPSGLASAIRLKQINPEISVVVVEKGSEVGAHILSGAVIDPVGLDRLLPDVRPDLLLDFSACFVERLRFALFHQDEVIPIRSLDGLRDLPERRFKDHFIEFRNHRYAAVSPRRFDMLAECISVSHRSGMRNRRV